MFTGKLLTERHSAHGKPVCRLFEYHQDNSKAHLQAAQAFRPFVFVMEIRISYHSDLIG